MRNDSEVRIALVDDDAVFLKSLEIEFQQAGGFVIQTFDSGERCLANLSPLPDIIVMDYSLDGTNKNAMNGIEALDKIKELMTDIPVIMLSGQDKIEVAVNCMHHKAFDYVVKSETSFFRLQKVITSILRIRKMEKELVWYMDRM